MRLMAAAEVLSLVLVLALPGCTSLQASLASDPFGKLREFTLADARHALEIARAEGLDELTIVCLERVVVMGEFLTRSHEGAQGLLTSAVVAQVLARDGDVAGCAAALATSRFRL